MDKIKRIQEIYRRGLQDRLPPEKRAIADELIRRGVVKIDTKPKKQKIVGGLAEGLIQGVRSELEEKGAGIAQLTAEVGLSPVERALKKISPKVGVGLQQAREKTSQELTQAVETSRQQRRAGLTAGQKRAESVGKVGAKIAQTGLLAPATIVGSGLEGAVEGALKPTETGTIGERAKNIAKESAIQTLTFGLFKGGVKTLGVAGRGAKAGVKSIFASKYYDDFAKTIGALKEKSSNIYKAMREVNADISDTASQKIVNSLDETLFKSGKLNSRLHGDTMSVVSNMRDDLVKNKKVSLEGLDQFRQLFNQVIVKNTDVAGNLNPDGQKAVVLIKKIDDLVDNLKPSDLSQGGENATKLLSLARSDWKVYKKFQKITNVLGKAGGDPNRIKAGFKRFVNKPKNLLGYTDLEKRALRRVASNTSGEKILKQLGKFGVDLGTSLTPGNTFLPVASMFASSLSGTLSKGAGIVALGTISRQIQRLLAKGKVNEALQIIEAGGLTDIANIVNKAPTQSAKKELLTKLVSLGILRGTNEIREE
jgi:hypothetical protein